LNAHIFILQNIEQVFVVEEIKTPSTIYFKKGNAYVKPLFGMFKNVINNLDLYIIHSEGFSRAGLAISKASYDTIVKKQWN
jgi:hypothetical protein